VVVVHTAATVTVGERRSERHVGLQCTLWSSRAGVWVTAETT